MRKNILYIIAICVYFSLNVSAQNKKEKDLTVHEYLNKYKDIAIQEMERSGIPASITLAQGIHESSFGNSNLSKKSNNHFGIKCGKSWKGGEYYKWDDDPQKSCFRVYESAEESYVDHTDFLMNGRRYAFLFEYGRQEYKKWAKGLRKAGYATDPRYPDKLIHSIEKYNLTQYDLETGLISFNTKESAESSNLPIFSSTGKLRDKPRSFFFKIYKAGLYKENGSTYAISRKGESALAVAKRFGIPYKRFLKFNDLKDGDLLINYQPTFIQPKKSVYRGDEAYYKVNKDITMYEIAQCFGIKLSNLLTRNLMLEGEEPLNGEKIYLKEKSDVKPLLRTRNHIDLLPEMYLHKDTIKTGADNHNKNTISNNTERPEPDELEINTTTYTGEIYSDTTELNTSISSKSDFLDIKITSADTITEPIIVAGDNNKEIKIKSDYYKANPFSADMITESSKMEEKDTKINESAIFKSNYNNNLAETVNNITEKVVILPNEYNTEFTADLKRHRVKKGETLYRLHRLYDVSVESIRVANNIKGTSINTGEVLEIPLR
jgi:LysM repeat protein